MRLVGFEKLKQKIAVEARLDAEFRSMVAKFVDTSQLKAYTRSKRGVVLIAKNKACAQELFLKREALRHAFACEVIIK